LSHVRSGHHAAMFDRRIARGGSTLGLTKDSRMSRFSLQLVAGLAGLLAASSALAYSGEKFEAAATIKMAQATEIARKARSGQVTDRELEREGGGSGLRYSFDI